MSAMIANRMARRSMISGPLEGGFDVGRERPALAAHGRMVHRLVRRAWRRDRVTQKKCRRDDEELELWPIRIPVSTPMPKAAAIHGMGLRTTISRALW